METASGSRHNKVESLDELLDYVRKKRDQGFWGEVWVKFRNGVPYLIKEIRQIKLNDEQE